ncbi:MAG TPA: succinyl-diaminopimelate desuccinylase [Solirubrobacteraceae bacterium]|nr:succinyl-diaminopimelate desuccinylase [Solirubrobacteraceae bacterium]
MTDPLPGRLAARTLELVDIASESRAEQVLAGHVLRVLGDGGVPVRDAGDTCILAGATVRTERPLVLLAGHLDTVPAQGNRPGRIEGGAVHGLGAADMKGALAVMIELALGAATAERVLDLGFVFFGREELAHTESALEPLLAREAGLRGADLAIVMEPTANALQLGCLGNINATWTFHGRSGHSARPWLADNAIHRAAAGIATLAAVGPVEHDAGGLRFTEVASVTRIEGGIAANVIPDVARAHVNYRYPPGMTPADAERRLHELCDPHGELVIDTDAPSGPVPHGNALVAALQRTAGLPVEAKQAWTPVAEFGLAGVDAVNFGPGDPPQAHTRGEHVSADALARSHRTLTAFAAGATV